MVLFRLYLFIEPTGKYTLWLVPLTFIGTVILIVLCQMFWVGGVQPGGIGHRVGGLHHFNALARHLVAVAGDDQAT